MTRPRGVPALAMALALAAPVAHAQISPGPLSRAHAKLEGSTHCLDCHDSRKGVASDKCLACHKPLQERVAAGKGLHARPEYRDCKTCHVEHQGVEYEILWWGKAGKEAFDHAQTGHVLGGKHAALSCGQCHKTRSFLGSATACASCHKDEHRAQFVGRACSSCHTEQAWKPAPGFDHARTSWPLSGRHAPVSCEKCHATRRPDPANAAVSYRIFRAVAGRDCASCHQDAHKGRLGTNCTSCHNTSGWRGSAATKAFDHSKTAYPLTGRHAGVSCGKCHVPGRPMRVKHDRCTDCHADSHAGQLARRADGGRCESCHDVNGFRPARFGPEDHAKTAYALVGAHLAVACDQCHRPGVGGAPRTPSVPLHFPSTRCADCHKDPHQGEVARFVAKAGCESCHRLDSWRQVAFDHAQTRYPLSGGHSRVACTPCHRRGEAAVAPAVLRFVGLTQTCESCHRDPHQGQFARAGAGTSCERCHTTNDLKASKFDHSRDAAYKLDGAHVRLVCSTCHRPEMRNGVTFIRYTRLPTTCRGCHGESPKTANGDRL